MGAPLPHGRHSFEVESGPQGKKRVENVALMPGLVAIRFRPGYAAGTGIPVAPQSAAVAAAGHHARHRAGA